MAKREDIGSDDVVGILLDTFHDQRRSYIFITNPLGIQQDGISTEGQEDDYSFDTLWHSEGRLTADGYVAGLVLVILPPCIVRSPRCSPKPLATLRLTCPG